MRVIYKSFRKGGVDMTGKIVEMDDAAAAPLILSNIVQPVGPEPVIETAAIVPPEKAVRPQPRRKHVTKAQHRSNR